MNVTFSLRDIGLMSMLIIVAILTRTVFHIAPNVEFITGSGIVAGYFLRERAFVFFVPFLAMAITDLIIGNTLIYMFTWSGFLAIPLLGLIARTTFIQRILPWQHELKLLTVGVSSGVLATLFFFVWTNFGVVVLGWYPMTVEGLASSYTNAIPFLRNQLFGNIIIVPAMFMVSNVYMQLFESKVTLENSLQKVVQT